jgi:hypothetical protein
MIKKGTKVQFRRNCPLISTRYNNPIREVAKVFEVNSNTRVNVSLGVSKLIKQKGKLTLVKFVDHGEDSTPYPIHWLKEVK